MSDTSDLRAYCASATPVDPTRAEAFTLVLDRCVSRDALECATGVGKFLRHATARLQTGAAARPVRGAKRGARALPAGDDELVVDCEDIPLVCPLSRQPITLPARAKACLLLACCDLGHWIAASLTKRASRPHTMKLTCPNCQIQCHIQDVEIDLWQLQEMCRIRANANPSQAPPHRLRFYADGRVEAAMPRRTARGSGDVITIDASQASGALPSPPHLNVKLERCSPTQRSLSQRRLLSERAAAAVLGVVAAARSSDDAVAAAPAGDDVAQRNDDDDDDNDASEEDDADSHYHAQIIHDLASQFLQDAAAGGIATEADGVDDDDDDDDDYVAAGRPTRQAGTGQSSAAAAATAIAAAAPTAANGRAASRSLVSRTLFGERHPPVAATAGLGVDATCASQRDATTVGAKAAAAAASSIARGGGAPQQQQHHQQHAPAATTTSLSQQAPLPPLKGRAYCGRCSQFLALPRPLSQQGVAAAVPSQQNSGALLTCPACHASRPAREWSYLWHDSLAMHYQVEHAPSNGLTFVTLFNPQLRVDLFEFMRGLGFQTSGAGELWYTESNLSQYDLDYFEAVLRHVTAATAGAGAGAAAAGGGGRGGGMRTPVNSAAAAAAAALWQQQQQQRPSWWDVVPCPPRMRCVGGGSRGAGGGGGGARGGHFGTNALSQASHY